MNHSPATDILLKAQLTEGTAKPIIDMVVEALRVDPPYPDGCGTGYVMAAGGRYAKHGYATCRFIREVLQDPTPIEVWVGANERMEADKWGIPDVIAVQDSIDGGWPLKASAVMKSDFRNVVFLDSDCIPLMKAQELVTMPEYQVTGAVFFPDVAEHRRSDWAFQALGLKLGSVPEMEAGQFLIDKYRHSVAVKLTNYFNQHPEFFYKHNFGDKDLWALAFARLGLPFTTSKPCENMKWGLRHFLPDGSLGFDHLIHTKFAGQEYDGPAAKEILGFHKDYSLL